jgi:stage II sporulation protein D
MLRSTVSLRLQVLGGLALTLVGCAPAELEPGVVVTALSEPNIRIGVAPLSSSVTIGSTGNYVVKSKATGATLFTGTNGSAIVSLESGSTSISRWRVQVTCSNPTNVATRKAAAEAAGYATFTEFVAAANCTRLYIGELPSTATTAERTALKNELIAKGLAAADAIIKLVTQVVGTTVYRVLHGTASTTSDSPVVLTADANVTIAGATYRGVAEVTRNSTGTLAGVNELPMEQYLYGVVPRELGPIAWPQMEAQKAQAVAARAYAVRGLGKRAADGYDMLATTTDQVYGGFAAEHPVSSAAVDATRGLVPTHDGKVIESLFYSTSGGTTANNEDVFNSTAIAYLRGIIDAEVHKHKGSYVLDERTEPFDVKELKKKAKKDFEADQSKYHRWVVTWTPEQMSEVITDFAKSLPAGFAGASVGKVLAVNVLERSNSGRIKTIEYVTEAGVFTDTKDRVRSSLKFFNETGVKTNLYSSLFVIEAEEDCNDGEVLGYTAYGGGFGHGVGMNQTGAAGMAVAGYTFDGILRRYYQGITITPWY